MRTAEAAKVLSRTSFIPDAMRGKPEEVATAMMRSLELGIDPLDGLSNLHVIKGKVGYQREFMRRRIIEAGHDIEFDEQTDERCKIRGRRAGSRQVADRHLHRRPSPKSQNQPRATIPATN